MAKPIPRTTDSWPKERHLRAITNAMKALLGDDPPEIMPGQRERLRPCFLIVNGIDEATRKGADDAEVLAALREGASL